MGIWRLIRTGTRNLLAVVCVNNQLSEAFVVERGVKQDSVLSSTLFLVVMDQLLKQMRESNHGLSLCSTYAGAAIHADDLCTVTAFNIVFASKYDQ